MNIDSATCLAVSGASHGAATSELWRASELLLRYVVDGATCHVTDNIVFPATRSATLTTLIDIL